MKNINQEEFIKLSKEDGYVILDVRMPNEVSSGALSGSVAIDFLNNELFLSEIEKLDKDKSYLVYCRSGNRSGSACQVLGQKGFSDLYNLDGGLMGWEGPVN